MPSFRHVFVLVLENKDFSQIVGSSQAPYLNGLIARYGLATAYRGLFHPSQPNYIAMVSGSRQGVRSDGPHTVAATSLFDQIEAAGRDWRVVAENVPTGCFTGETASGGPDGTGVYARKHNPAISFASIQRSPARCRKIEPLSAFDPAAADFQLIVPNQCHDMHDCSVAQGDRWLSQWLPNLLASDALRNGGVLFITTDESSGATGSRLPTIVVGPTVKPGFRSSDAHTHYSLLRTIQDAWGLRCLKQSCRDGNLGEFFQPGG